ncbi:DUF4236 domain-containing protein [Clostridium sp. YIM B02500]|uniref:DUF4236 domain-containing protein n=1 Tax=Clostridium sp. YIM B02500 TaxID=2910681 RepID=UPI001EECFADD|nr:DUF4236 domain-containing protein [Clostridium sp. YIM B02500]
MGFKFRKSVNLGGGFRINISKSGVGYSWGFPGYRISSTAKGSIRETFSIHGTGISYTEESKNHSPRQHIPEIKIKQMSGPYINIDSAPIENFQNVDYSELTQGIEQIMCNNKFHKNIMLALWCCFAVSFFARQPIIPVLVCIALILKSTFHTNAKIDLQYIIDNDKMKEYVKKMKKLKDLNYCHGKWQVTQYAHVTGYQRKYNSGVTRSINRQSFKLIEKKPSFLTSNVDVIQLVLEKEILLFLPDKILILKDNNVGVISYNSLSIDFDTVNFVESEGVPKDSQILYYTWQYVNKNGSPDRRFNNNRELPVCLYYNVYITSTEGLNINLQFSNEIAIKDFECITA